MKVAVLLAGVVLSAFPLYAQEAAPEAPVVPSAPVVASTPVEETVTMTGVLLKKDAGGKVIYLFADDATKKRLQAPLPGKNWPEGINPEDFLGNVTMTAITVTKEKAGKKSAHIKKVISLEKVEAAAAP